MCSRVAQLKGRAPYLEKLMGTAVRQELGQMYCAQRRIVKRGSPKESNMEFSITEVSNHIYSTRGCQVMLDSDLAEIYEVEVGALKRAVRRNIERFPGDFMFELSKKEIENLICQSGISSSKNDFYSHGGNRHTPFAFTEPGVAMLSTVLHTRRAIQINIEIMRAFVQLRKQPKAQHFDWAPRFESLENEVKRIRQRLDQPETQSKNEKPQDPVSRIQNIVARHWGLKVDDLKSATRTKAISLPRQIAIYLIRTQIQMSFSDIGSHFGQRDHTSILYAYRKIEAAYGANNMIRETLHFLKEKTWVLR